MRYQREDWLARGLDTVVKEGLGAVTIDAMCRQLGVTKGSFYHHFANREAFLEGILAYWETHHTANFITYSEAGANAHAKMERLLHLVVASHNDSEVAIRVWAQSDPLARTYQARVDAQRVAYLEQLLTALGHEGEAHHRATMLYTLLVGAQTIVPPLSRDDLQHIFQQMGIWLTASVKENRPHELPRQP